MATDSLDLKANVLEWTLTADGTDHYIFAGPGFAGTETDPAIYVMRGHTYKFTNNMNLIRSGFRVARHNWHGYGDGIK